MIVRKTRVYTVPSASNNDHRNKNHAGDSDNRAVFYLFFFFSVTRGFITVLSLFNAAFTSRARANRGRTTRRPKTARHKRAHIRGVRLDSVQ